MSQSSRHGNTYDGVTRKIRSERRRSGVCCFPFLSTLESTSSERASRPIFPKTKSCPLCIWKPGRHIEGARALGMLISSELMSKHPQALPLWADGQGFGVTVRSSPAGWKYALKIVDVFIRCFHRLSRSGHATRGRMPVVHPPSRPWTPPLFPLLCILSFFFFN